MKLLNSSEKKKKIKKRKKTAISSICRVACVRSIPCIFIFLLRCLSQDDCLLFTSQYIIYIEWFSPLLLCSYFCDALLYSWFFGILIEWQWQWLWDQHYCVCGPFCKTTFPSMWKTVSIDLVFLPRTKVASNYCHSTSSFFFFCFSQGDLFGLHGIFRLKSFNNSALFVLADVWIRLSGHSYCNILRNKHFLCLNSQRDENMHAFFCMDTYEILWATYMTVMENCRSHDWPRPFEYHDKPHTS